MKPKFPLFLLAASALLSGLFGFIGFRELGGDLPLSTSFYRALQLFTLQGGDVEGDVPALLEVARFLAPATTLGGIYAAAHALVVGYWGRLRLRSARGHVVVCGGGDKGLALARALARRKNMRVVVVDIEEHESLLRLRRAGVITVRGDAGRAPVLAEAGIKQAARLVCLSGDDRVNTGIALCAASSLPASRAGNPLEIHVHVREVAMRDILQRNRLFEMEHDPRHRIRLFNSFANRARLALARCPLEWDARSGLHGEAHLVLGPLGPLEKAILVHAAQVGHFRKGGRIQAHLVSSRATADKAALLKEYPGFRNCAGLEIVPLATADGFVDAVADIARAIAPNALLTVVPNGPASTTIADALLIGERLHDGPRLRILLDASGDAGIRITVAENPALAPWIHFLPDLADAIDSDVLFNESLDVVARRIHGIWKREVDERIRLAELAGDPETAAAHRAKDTYRDWDALTERQKEDNRSAADHIAVKIRAVGLDPEDHETVRTAWPALDEDRLEMLARMEHERWAAVLWLAGWTPGPRDDARKTHPNLVPFDQLDEDTRQFDADQVKGLLDLI